MYDIVFEFEQQRIFDRCKNRNKTMSVKQFKPDYEGIAKVLSEFEKLYKVCEDEKMLDNALREFTSGTIDFGDLPFTDSLPNITVSNSDETYIDPTDYHKTRYEIKERLYDDIDDFMKNTDPEGSKIGILENSNELVQRKGRFAFVVLSSLKVVEHIKSEAQIDFKMNFDQTDKLLNDVLNKAMCRPTRIKKPNSNTVAQFVIDYMKENNMV